MLKIFHRHKKMIKMKNLMKIFVIFLLVFFTQTAFALKNPAAVYCKEMGYTWDVEEINSAQIDLCKFSDTILCYAYEFLVGTCGTEYSYCSKMGYEIKTVTGLDRCRSVPTYLECSVCVLENGTEVEVTKLMGLSFEEGVCGDGNCVLGESYLNCAEDCPSGSADGYCDEIIDGICDPDCEEDVDCLCGDGFCEFGETKTNCCYDCGCPSDMKCIENSCQTLCGNNICDSEYGENPKNCSQDCKEDFILDPLIIVIPFLVLLLILAFIYKRREEKKKY